MAISKVIFNGTTQMDDTSNTITASTVLDGYVGKGADGETVVGTATVPNVQTNRSYSVSSSGSQTINPSSGYDAMSSVALTVPSGTATSASSISGSSASVSTGTNTITLSKSVSNTPRITTAGYISSGTAGSSSVSLTASVTTKGATNYYPEEDDGSHYTTISSGTYLTGDQTIYHVLTTNLIASNIKKDVVVKLGDIDDDDRISSITGTYEGSGGGATNFVTGTFTTGSSTSTTGTVSITYSGSGYPIMLAIWVENGCYNSSGASGWYNSLTRYAVGQVIITKGVTTSTPTYTTSGAANYGTIQVLYKNSTSSATSYSSTRAASANSYSSSNANGTSTTCVRWKGNKSLSYYVSGGTSSTYGLLASTTYRYVVYYSA